MGGAGRHIGGAGKLVFKRECSARLVCPDAGGVVAAVVVAFVVAATVAVAIAAGVAFVVAVADVPLWLL